MLVVGGVCHGIQQRKVWWQKPVHHRNMTYFMDCWHQVVRMLVYPSNTKSKKIHGGLLQFAVKVICTMLHVCMVWGLQILSNTSTRKSVKKHNLLLMKVYSETDTHASGWWCVPWNSTKESLQMAPSHCSPHSSVVKFQWVVPMILVYVNLWMCWCMHPIVGFGAPPWVSDIAGSTNFV